MEFVNRILSPLTEQFGPLAPLLAVGLLGLFMVLLTVPLLLKGRNDPLDRLKAQSRPPSERKPRKERLRHASRNERLDKFAHFLEPQDEKELTAIQLKLRQAGYQTKDAVRYYHFGQMALGLLGLGLGLVYVTLLGGGEGKDTQQMMLWVIGPGGAGYLLPKYWVNRRVEERKKQIAQGFPDALDMLLVCVEAGQSLDQSIVRVSRELRSGFPALAEEFEVVSHEMKAGKEKERVLRDMSDRCGVPDVASFVTVLIQSAGFGTSIADALRVYAGEMRDKRVMRAEEAANKLPTKMTLATMALTVPPLLIILIGPSIKGIMELGNIGQ